MPGHQYFSTGDAGIDTDPPHLPALIKYMTSPQRLIIGISGASGVALGIRALEILQPLPIESHLVVSKATALTVASETDLTMDEIKALADEVYGVNDIAASLSSGSFKTMGMLIAPCSIKTLGEICLLYTSPSPRDATLSRMPSSA